MQVYSPRETDVELALHDINTEEAILKATNPFLFANILANDNIL